LIRNKIYFLSDFHLGIPNHEKSLLREKKIVHFLNHIKSNAKEIYLLGDIFDFWFEYNKSVPKGFVRLMGKIAELTDDGIKIYFFKGNHDLWTFGYLKKELGVKVIDKDLTKIYGGKVFYMHHGDGLGPDEFGFKFLKSIFTSKLCQFMFSWIHPDIGIRIAQFWAKKSRIANRIKEDTFNNEKERQISFCRNYLKSKKVDYFIFGHRHYPIDYKLQHNSRMINLGEWVNFNSYAVFDGLKLELKHYE